MKKKSIKNKNLGNLNPMSAALAGASISEAIKQLTGGSNIPVANAQLPALEAAVEAPEPVAYKMRVECYDDSALLYEMLWPYLEYWEEKRECIKAKGQEFKGPGVVIRFGITPGSLTLQNLQSLFHCVPDCHVAEETVALERSFTGKRKEVAEKEFQAPKEAITRPMVQRVETARHYLRILLRRTESLLAMLEGVASSGVLPQMSQEGFISLLEHKPSGLSSILRVAAVTGTEDPVKDRLILLQH